MRHTIVLTTALVLAFVWFGSSRIAAGEATKQPPKQLGDAIVHPPKDAALYHHVTAKGDQIFVCTKVGDGYEWVPRPDATLYDDAGEKAGTHYKGPSWELKDGSKIVCKKVAESKRDGACALLELKVTEHSSTGILSGVDCVLRLNTTGGVKPAKAATAENLGEEIRVPYTADYYFYGPPK